MRLDRLDLCHADPPLGERRPGLHRAACWLASLVRACNRKSSISCDANRVLANRPLVKRARSGDRAPRARRPIERALRSVRCGTRLVRSRAGSCRRLLDDVVRQWRRQHLRRVSPPGRGEQVQLARTRRVRRVVPTSVGGQPSSTSSSSVFVSRRNPARPPRLELKSPSPLNLRPHP